MVTPRRSRLLQFAITFLTVEGLFAALWWGSLTVSPSLRRLFLPSGTPDASLLAFALPDMVFYIGGALASAYALTTQRSWWLLALCIHAGAAGYAALYTIALSALASCCGLGAVLMAPSLVVPPLLIAALMGNFDIAFRRAEPSGTGPDVDRVHGRHVD